MKLVICEKNIAANRIAYFLSNGKSKTKKIGSTPVYEFSNNGEEWKVIGLRGHIINLDYPKSYNQWNKIKPSDLIEIKPVKKISEKRIASALKTLADKNPFLIVATDYDREGELIGVEVVNLLRDFNNNINDIKRAHFSAITGYEIKNAFDKLVEVDYNLSDAGESRQIIDLIWGAVLTRFISITSRRYGREFLSIGRVQSPTLAILVEREKEIQNFKPEPFWKIIASLTKNSSFNCSHVDDPFYEEDKVNKIFDRVKNAKEAKVDSIDKKEIKELPPSPFSTTTFLQSASYLNVSASKAMSVAEELYMMGLISYPRTDNTVYPSSINTKNILKKLLKSSFSKEAQQVIDNPRKYPTRGKKKTTDHPPIHPVDAPGNKKLNSTQEKLYELICRRFIATFAKDDITETVDAIFDISGEKFKAKGYRSIETNWKNIYPYFKEKGKALPELKKGEIVKVNKIKVKKDQTKPPSRYNQGSLISKMEKLELGTKSTRHEIINKLYNRKYIQLKPLKPTPIAFAVVDAMEDCEVIKPKMTAKLEEDMDLIAEGKKTLDETVEESRKMLTEVMKDLEKNKEKIRKNIQSADEKQNTIGKCPKCGKDMIIRFSKRKKRFVGCTGYPDCKNTYSLPQKGGIVTTDKTCSKCGAPIVKIITKGKKPWRLCLSSECSTKNNNNNNKK